ncbi:MAG TPA: hypothetical protein VGE46_04890 [Bdellovibrio sp.]
MKLILSCLILLFTSLSFADVVQPADVSLDQSIVGGHVILLQMKDHLVISGAESASLDQELSPSLAKDMIRDLVMGNSAQKLASSYNPGKNRPTVERILNRYLSITAKPTLN